MNKTKWLERVKKMKYLKSHVVLKLGKRRLEKNIRSQYSVCLQPASESQVIFWAEKYFLLSKFLWYFGGDKKNFPTWDKNFLYFEFFSKIFCTGVSYSTGFLFNFFRAIYFNKTEVQSAFRKKNFTMYHMHIFPKSNTWQINSLKYIRMWTNIMRVVLYYVRDIRVNFNTRITLGHDSFLVQFALKCFFFAYGIFFIFRSFHFFFHSNFFQ